MDGASERCGKRRARVCGSVAWRGDRWTQVRRTPMLSKGPAKKVTIYVNEDTRHHLGPLYQAILTFLMHKGVAGATATRALSGFGANRELHTPNVEVMAFHLPIRIEF